MNFSSNTLLWKYFKEKSIRIELPSGSTMNTLLDLLYRVSVHLFILFLSPSLEHLWFNFYKEKPSVSCCDDVVIGTMEIVTGIATLEWGAVKIWGLTDPYTDFQPFLFFFSYISLLTWWKYLTTLKPEFPIVSRPDLTCFTLSAVISSF